MKKRASIIALLMVAAISLTACGGSGGTAGGDGKSGEGYTEIKATDASKSPAAATARKDTFIYGATEMNGVWSDMYTNSNYDAYATHLMFDHLIDATADGKPVENAASYKISDDGLKYTFTLKDKLKFWDGTAVTAKDVEFVYYLLSDPSFDGQYDLASADIKGFTDYKTGSAEKIEGIKVVDDKNIEITLNAPNAPALWNLGKIQIMSKVHYAPDFKKGDGAAVTEKLAAPMGTGAYKFISYAPGSTLKLEANPDYFKGAPKIKNVEFTVTPEGQELQKVQAGEADMSEATCSEDNVASMKASEFINGFYYPVNGYGMIQWNVQDPKFSDAKVRQALAYALNREAVVKQVYGQYGKVSNVPVPQGSWGYTTDGTTDYKFDIEKAKTLLKEAGWAINSSTQKLEKDGKAFVINFTATSGNPVTDIMLPLMKEDYAKLGIDVTIETADFATLLKGYNEGTLDACFLGMALTTPDPDQSITFKTDAPQNFYKYSNSKMDELFKKELAETDTAKRTEIFKELNKLFNSELPIFPIYQRNEYWVINSRIENIQPFGPFREPFFDLYQYTIKQ